MVALMRRPVVARRVFLNRPALCRFDIRMPDIDGIEATRQLAGADVDDPLGTEWRWPLPRGRMNGLGARNRIEIATRAYETGRMRG